ERGANEIVDLYASWNWCAHHLPTPSRIDVSVLSRDSRGTDSTNPLTNHPKPNGMERLRLMDSHSMTTPPSCSRNLQYEFRRHRKPLSSPMGFSISEELPAFWISAILVVKLRLDSCPAW